MSKIEEAREGIKKATEDGDVHALNKHWYNYFLYGIAGMLYGDEFNIDTDIKNPK